MGRLAPAFYSLAQAITMKNSFGSRSLLRVGNREFEIYRLDSLEKQGLKMARLPYSLRILLENLLRREDGEVGHGGDDSLAGR